MKKILLVADLRGWIFERHCREIKKRLFHKYDIGITYGRGAPSIHEQAKEYDLVYVLDPLPIHYPPKEKTIMGLRAEWIHNNHRGKEEGLYLEGLPGNCGPIKDICSIFHVVNKRQLEKFKPIVQDKPLLLVQHGVDMECFNIDKNTRINQDRDIYVGLSGRSDSPNKKGFEIVNDVCKSIGLPFITTQYSGKRLGKELMPVFYNNIDVYVCMSETEGLNNPILESGAMGVPVISTRSGAAEEMINDSNGILINRDKRELKDALIRMQDYEIRKALGNAFYEEIKSNWSWDIKVKEYESMFDLFFEGQ